jgi:translation initiation factor 1A
MPKKSKKNKGSAKEPKVRELEFKEDLQEYGKIISLLGDRRMTVKLPDGTDIMGHVRDAMRRKRVYIKTDDVVLVSRREFQEDKVDIIHKYVDTEVKNLVNYGEVPEWFLKTSAMIVDDAGTTTGGDLGFDFSVVEEEIDFDDI